MLEVAAHAGSDRFTRRLAVQSGAAGNPAWRTLQVRMLSVSWCSPTPAAQGRSACRRRRRCVCVGGVDRLDQWAGSVLFRRRRPLLHSVGVFNPSLYPQSSVSTGPLVQVGQDVEL